MSNYKRLKIQIFFHLSIFALKGVTIQQIAPKKRSPIKHFILYNTSARASGLETKIKAETEYSTFCIKQDKCFENDFNLFSYFAIFLSVKFDKIIFFL